MKKTTHGGKRPNAGRKKKYDITSVSPAIRKAGVSGSFGLSDYIRSLFEKNSPLQIIPAKMNKKRACYALAILSKMQSELDILIDSPDEETYAEYQEAIRWMKNQILKRYSVAETVL